MIEIAKRIYAQTIIKWLIGIGATGGTIVGGIFYYLSVIGAIDVLGFSGDMVCAGTEEHPCYAFINFTANEDIFLYPIGYDPWGRNTTFEFEPNLKSWKLQRSWGSGWRDIPLDKSCTGTWCGLSNKDDKRKFSIAFREGRTYRIRIVGFKNNPFETIKWSAFDGAVDPEWIGISRPGNFIGEGGISMSWTVKKSGIDELTEVEWEILNDSTTNFTFTSKNLTFYNSELVKQGGDIRSIPMTKTKGADKFSLDKSVINFKNGKTSFLVHYNNLTEGMEFKIGLESVVISAIGSVTATALPTNDNFCISITGKYHSSFRDNANDIGYSTSSDNGATWDDSSVLAGSFTNVGITCMNNGSIFIHFIDGAGTDSGDIIQSTDDGVSWGNQVELFNAEGTDFINCKGDSNSVLHCVGKLSSDTWYVNNSDITEKEISGADSDNMEIGVDYDDNVFIVITDSSTDDLDIMSSKDGWSTRNEWDAEISVDGGDSTPSIAFCQNGTMYVSHTNADDLQFCTGNTAFWTSPDSCTEIDSSSSFWSNIGASEACNPYIIYMTSSSEGTVVMANRTDGGSFEIRTTIESSAIHVTIGDSVFPPESRTTNKLHYVGTDSSTVIYRNISIQAVPIYLLNITSPLTDKQLFTNSSFNETIGFKVFKDGVEQTVGVSLLNITVNRSFATIITNTIKNPTNDNIRVCSDWSSNDCGTLCPSEADNTFDGCINCNSEFERINEIYLNGSIVNQEDTIEVTCEYFTTETTASEIYVFYRNSTSGTWLQKFSGSSSGTASTIRNLTPISIDVDNINGEHQVRCIIQFQGENDECAGGLFFDNDDVNFTVIPTTITSQEFGYNGTDWVANVTMPVLDDDTYDLTVNATIEENTVEDIELDSVVYGAGPVGDTCDCSSIQSGIDVDCSENCDIEACDAQGQDITFVGDGNILVLGDVTNHGNVSGFPITSCKVHCLTGCFESQ